MTPEEKLFSRSWRLRNSAGILWSILSLGILTGVGFLIRGVEAKNKLWIGLGIGFLVLGVGVFAAAAAVDPGTPEEPTAAFTIWGWVWILTMTSGISVAIATNRKWLVWKAYASEWYEHVTPALGYDPNAADAALRSPAPAHTVPAATTPVSTIDVNSATTAELQAVLGIDAAAANRIIDTRQRQGPFASFEQLMATVQIQPHLLIPQRQRLTFGQGTDEPGQAAQRQPNQGQAAQGQPDQGHPKPAVRRLDL